MPWWPLLNVITKHVGFLATSYFLCIHLIKWTNTMYLKPLSHQPYGSRTPVYENRWVSCSSRRTFLDVLTKFTGRKAVATSKTKFSTCPFSLRSSYHFLKSQCCCYMKARKAAARQHRDASTIDVRFSTLGLLSNNSCVVFRRPQVSRANTLQ